MSCGCTSIRKQSSGVCSQAEKAGVTPERLIFDSQCSPKLEHLRRVTLADLALDTLVYNGYTTASDMLWAGVPLITMHGDNCPSVVTSCIVALKKVKAKLVEKHMTVPLFDSILWIGDFEKGLDEI